MKFKKIGISILAVALAMSLSACSGATKKIGTAPDGSEVAIEKSAIKFYNEVTEVGYNLLTAEDLKKQLGEKEDIIVVDTMPENSYTKNHIPTALNAELPVKIEDVTPEQKAKFLEVLGQDKGKKVVLYCGFVGCARSHVGAKIAKEAGFTNIYRQPGGIIAWLEAGYPVEK